MYLGNANFGFPSATNHDLKIDKLLKLTTLKKNEIGEAKVVENGMNITKIDLVTVSDAILTGRQTRLEIRFVLKSDVKSFS